MKKRSIFSLIMSLTLGVGSLPTSAQEIQRDYAPTTPLPNIGRTTIRDNIRNLPTRRIFTQCPSNSIILEFAESKNYLVIICSQENDRNVPKYWIQRPKNGGSDLRINVTFDEGMALYERGEYSYSIYSDGIRPERLNAYLQRYNRNFQKGFGEALLYHYNRRYQDFNRSTRVTIQSLPDGQYLYARVIDPKLPEQRVIFRKIGNKITALGYNLGKEQCFEGKASQNTITNTISPVFSRDNKLSLVGGSLDYLGDNSYSLKLEQAPDDIRRGLQECLRIFDSKK
jgi:hypothetical protein